MIFSELAEKLRARAGVAAEPHFNAYRATTGQPTLDGFITFLRQHGVIDAALFTDLHTGGAVDVTDVAASTAFHATALAPERSPSTPAPAEGGRAAAASQPPPPYEVLGELGKGAMGAVHLAQDLVLRRKVALKSILPEMQAKPSLVRRFLGEMQITAQLDHPSIVPIYAVEDGPGGGLAYSMKVVQGRELSHLLDETKALLDAGKPLPPSHRLEARLEAFLKVCDAVAYANQRGVVHRDLKPDNIMLGPFNVVYVMDWGIARLMGDGGRAHEQGLELHDGGDAGAGSRTHVGSTIGTPIYMSPEQAAGNNDRLDGRSDLYSLGLILQQVVTLTRAIGGTTLEEVLTNAKGGKRLPPVPPAPGADVPVEIQAIIDKATRFNPDDRYGSVAELADEVRRYTRNEAILARPDGALQRAGRWVSRNRTAAIAMILGALVLGAGVTIGLLLHNRSVVAAQHQRELRLAEMQAGTSMRAQALDEALQGYEALLGRVAGAAVFALGDPRSAEVRLHFADEFEPGPRAVPGLVPSKVYGKPVSFAWPVAALAPGATEAALAGDVAAVSSLRGIARDTMVESADVDRSGLTEAERDRLLAEEGVPIRRVRLTLASGVHVEYPGMTGLDPAHDGRNDPLYQAASRGRAVTWGTPTPGRDGGVVLPCAVALWTDRGALRGVLTFEIDAARAVDAALRAPAGDFVETSLLVDRAGKVLAQRAHGDAAPEPETLGMAEVSAAIARGETGTLETERAGRPVVVTYQPLATLGWYLVTAADPGAMGDEPRGSSARPGSVAALPAASPASIPVAAAPPAAAATAAPAATPEPVVSASAEPAASASAAPSASAPKLWGTLPTAAPSSAPSAAPSAGPSSAPRSSDPFDPWDAYKAPK